MIKKKRKNNIKWSLSKKYAAFSISFLKLKYFFEITKPIILTSFTF